ncbi:DUF58 domain-containing protein [Anatilimnocola floriformis]|uniref:DUF58 domain-containing protein n=1 Tax=Anatilimnocola floriformis TaxID=2948575 RepID=UPI0020C25514|nr:DUF58 domain-containing protein [Anatilimnocola floriformis]
MTRNSHLRARLTREGWYYLAVLTFIVGGAALCHVNLLVVLGGMMLAPLLINWRLALASLRGIQIHRLPLRSVHAAQPLVVEFEITNRRRWFAAWLVVVEDRWQLLEEDPPSSRAGFWPIVYRGLNRLFGKSSLTSATTFVPSIEPGTTARTSYELLIPRRGRYALQASFVRSCFPLGLVEAIVTIREPREVLILPRIGRLSAEWTHRITAALQGEGERQLRHRSGDGDFFAVRPWQSGDSMRWMHWRTTARAGRPMVRQFERESTSTVALILDPFLPAQPTAGERARCEAAISFLATALADLAQRDTARLAVFVASASQPSWIGGRSPVFLEEVLAGLAELRGSPEDFRAAAAEQLDEQLPEPACVLVISSRPGNTVANSAKNAGENGSAELKPAEGRPGFNAGQIISIASPEFATLYSLE